MANWVKLSTTHDKGLDFLKYIVRLLQISFKKDQ